MLIKDLPKVLNALKVYANAPLANANEKNEIKRLLAQDPTTANIEELVKIYKVII